MITVFWVTAHFEAILTVAGQTGKKKAEGTRR